MILAITSGGYTIGRMSDGWILVESPVLVPCECGNGCDHWSPVCGVGRTQAEAVENCLEQEHDCLCLCVG